MQNSMTHIVIHPRIIIKKAQKQFLMQSNFRKKNPILWMLAQAQEHSRKKY